MGEEKRSPMPRIVGKEEAREEKKKENGAWEKKKGTPCPESWKKRKPGKRKRKRTGHGRGKKSPMPRIVIKGEAKQEKKKEKDHFQSTYR